MSEHNKHNTSNSQEEGGDVLSLVKKIQQHLVYLEKKIDMLVEKQGGGRPSFGGGGGRPSFGGGGGRPFKRPFKPRFERSGQGGGGDREQRDFSGPRPSFGDRGPRDRNRGGDRDERGGGGFRGRDKKPWGRRER